MNRAETAVKKFNEGYNCAQSVLYSFSDFTGMSEDTSLRIATGFGAGIGRTQHVCGAITGGILVLNAVFGRGLHDEQEVQEELFVKIQTFINEFEKQHNSIVCRELLDGCNLLSEAGQHRFNTENMRERCHRYITDVVTIVDRFVE